MKIENPHDKMFKETFSNIEVTKNFIVNYLPQSILDLVDIDTLEAEKDSFIDENLKETFSDLLFGVNINNRRGYIYFLFEHKSFRSKNITFQLLKYMVEIWDSKNKDGNSDWLPIIIPLVIYHGKERWNVKTTLGDMIEEYEDLKDDIKVFIPNYKYLLYDLSVYSDEDIKGIAQLRILFTIFRDIFIKDKEEIKQTIIIASKYLRELEDKQTGIEYFETFLRYIFSAGKSFDEKDIIEIIKEVERVYPEGSDLIVTTAERLRQEGLEEGLKEGLKEGLEEGLKEGREEGLKKGLLKTSIRLLTKKFGLLPDGIIEKLGYLDTDTLEVLIDDIFSYKNLDDLNKYLG